MKHYVICFYGNSSYYREFENIDTANHFVYVLKLYSNIYSNCFKKIRIKNAPYSNEHGFCNKRFNDARINNMLNTIHEYLHIEYGRYSREETS